MQENTSESTSTATAQPRASKSWVAPLLSTLVTLPLTFFAFLYVGLSPMACDPCNGEMADRFDASWTPAFNVFRFGLLLTLALLVGSWASQSERHTGRRVLFALLAPLSVLVLCLAFAGMVDWPDF
ncbi:hypothetical protein [Streptomyces sp. NPDC002851]